MGIGWCPVNSSTKIDFCRLGGGRPDFSQGRRKKKTFTRKVPGPRADILKVLWGDRLGASTPRTLRERGGRCPFRGRSRPESRDCGFNVKTRRFLCERRSNLGGADQAKEEGFHSTAFQHWSHVWEKAPESLPNSSPASIMSPRRDCVEH